MSLEMEIPSAFKTMRRREGGTDHPIVPRQNLDAAVVAALLGQLSAVRWTDVYHAYGPAGDVPGQLAAVIVGDHETRDEAWWNLWGDIHHQGTIYEATVPAVPILLGLAIWPDHPDRAQAILMLKEVAAAEGVYVWRYGTDGEIVSYEDEQRRSPADRRVVWRACLRVRNDAAAAKPAKAHRRRGRRSLRRARNQDQWSDSPRKTLG